MLVIVIAVISLLCTIYSSSWNKHRIENKINRYYVSNEVDLKKLTSLCDFLYFKNIFYKITISQEGAKQKLIVRFESNGNNDGMAYYFDLPGYKLDTSEIVSLSAETDSNFRKKRAIDSIVYDPKLFEVFDIFKHIRPISILVVEGGIFVSLYQPIKSQNPNTHSGIYFKQTGLNTSEEYPDDYIAKIDTNVYIEDAINR